MTTNYNPDGAASPVPPLSIAILKSQRDLEVQIPIDKIVQPGISVTTACFSNGVYNSDQARKCLANLLAVGYRRLMLDTYWDYTGKLWTICPVQSGATATNGSTNATKRRSELFTRQSFNGQITCTGSLSLESLGSVLVDYLKSTSTNLGARTAILSINVRAARSRDTSSISRLTSSQLPNGDQEISDALRGLANDLYTPVMLTSQREDLNSSWLGNPENSTPDLAYINTSLNSKGDLMTLTGWPNFGLVAFQKRVIVGIGPIEDSMRNYNTTNDFLVYHNTSSITSLHTVISDSSGITQGCLYDASSTDVALTSQWQINSNISVTADQSSLAVIPAITNLTYCGISPFVNATTSSSGQISASGHLSVILSSIWSWAPNEPRNISASDANANKLRCAMQDLSLSGHWKVANCDESHYSACRSNSNPLDWRFSPSRGAYTTRETSCPAGTTFSAPRTALENRYLANAFSQFRSTQPSSSEAANEAGPWVDFNALDIPACWVQGSRSTCPYTSGGVATVRRQVVIPIVAAVIVLVIAALLVFVKCAANRRNTRRGRKRRGKEDCGEYEGVPS